ncbi:hypothetical protein SLEP1_g31556 [Rubroshorea leprosula]|uniref:Uncharacterized protein n=1 Tax=Rubroshorea leprosula TaxID=152421 RepID=A0AAV5KA09_9ROSI|nr:hypothetical protein SLEP1_g31556 [Rubroshorea leprosula]
MAVSGPSSSGLFIWIVTCILFLFIAAGGICLLAYMNLPESEITHWLPIIGLSLVCLPWLFWFLTFVYRVISRKFGFRMVIGGNSGGGEDGNVSVSGDGAEASTIDHAKVVDVAHDSSLQLPMCSPAPSTDGKRVQFGATVVVGENYDQDERMVKKQSSLSSNSSVGSHESEIPLAFSVSS